MAWAIGKSAAGMETSLLPSVPASLPTITVLGWAPSHSHWMRTMSALQGHWATYLR